MNFKSQKSVIDRYIETEAKIIYFLLDIKGLILKSNAFASEILQDNIVGRYFDDIAVPFSVPISLLEAVQGGKKSIPITISVRSGLPRTFYFSFVLDREKIHAFGETSFTEAEELQKNIIKTNNELSNIARELHKSNAELRKLNDTKNQFLGMAAHDLRNPIGTIIAYVDFVLDEAKSLTSEQTDFLHIVKKSSKYMLELLNDILDIAKIESGKLNLNLKKTNFLEMLKDNVKHNKFIAEKKGVDLIIESYEHIPKISLDFLKIEQVLNNLISNAIKFSDPGKRVTLNIFMSGENVVVEVRDQGKGIPKDKLDIIFQPFNSASKQGTAGERSTGLGLAIVQKIVLGHRGRIWVESQVDKGSVFYFTLPVDDVHDK